MRRWHRKVELEGPWVLLRFLTSPGSCGVAGARLLCSPGVPLALDSRFRPDTASALQDQRLVGFPSLHLHLPLRCHADMVSLCPLSRGGLPGLWAALAKGP